MISITFFLFIYYVFLEYKVKPHKLQGMHVLDNRDNMSLATASLVSGLAECIISEVIFFNLYVYIYLFIYLFILREEYITNGIRLYVKLQPLLSGE